MFDDVHSDNPQPQIFICPQCELPKPSTEFNANSSKPTGRDYCCKDCTHKRQTAWYEKNKAHSVAKVAEWKKQHPEIIRERSRKYNETHRENIRAKDKIWRDTNKEKDRQRKREHDRNLPWENKAAIRCNDRAREKGVPRGMKPSDLYDPNTGVLPIFCPLFQHIRLDYSHGPDMRCWASVDRIVPALGYVSDNVRVISMCANTWKSNGSSPEERARIIEIMSPKVKIRKNLDHPSLFD